MHKLVVLLGLLSGCASAHIPPRSSRAVTEADVRTLARGLLEAYDSADDTRFRAGIDDTFALFEGKRLHASDELFARMHKRRARGAPRVLRSYEEEWVRLAPATAVYVARSTEHVGAEPDRPGRDYEGFSTLVFAPNAGGQWVAVHWAWERAGLAGTRELWNETFLDPGAVVAEPNQALVEAVRGVAAGTALDLGTGQGRNAIFLAKRGWDVTGVDISDVGLGIARSAAEAQKLDVRWVQADLDSWDYGAARYDLVTMLYMGSDAAMVRRAQASLKPGGLFVLSGFAPEPGAAGPDSAASGSLRAYFGDEFVVLRDERVQGISDWGQQPTQLIHFVARKR